MTAKEFLTENKDQVINFYNTKVKGNYNVSLKAFMVDLLENFRKITNGAEFAKFDLFANLDEAKSRLGLMNVSIGVSYSKPYSETNAAKRDNYYGKNSLVNKL